MTLSFFHKRIAAADPVAEQLDQLTKRYHVVLAALDELFRRINPDTDPQVAQQTPLSTKVAQLKAAVGDAVDPAFLDTLHHDQIKFASKAYASPEKNADLEEWVHTQETGFKALTDFLDKAEKDLGTQRTRYEAVCARIDRLYWRLNPGIPLTAVQSFHMDKKTEFIKDAFREKVPGGQTEFLDRLNRFSFPDKAPPQLLNSFLTAQEKGVAVLEKALVKGTYDDTIHSAKMSLFLSLMFAALLLIVLGGSGVWSAGTLVARSGLSSALRAGIDAANQYKEEKSGIATDPDTLKLIKDGSCAALSIGMNPTAANATITLVALGADQVRSGLGMGVHGLALLVELSAFVRGEGQDPTLLREGDVSHDFHKAVHRYYKAISLHVHPDKCDNIDNGTCFSALTDTVESLKKRVVEGLTMSAAEQGIVDQLASFSLRIKNCSSAILDPQFEAAAAKAVEKAAKAASKTA